MFPNDIDFLQETEGKILYQIYIFCESGEYVAFMKR